MRLLADLGAPARLLTHVMKARVLVGNETVELVGRAVAVLSMTVLLSLLQNISVAALLQTMICPDRADLVDACDEEEKNDADGKECWGCDGVVECGHVGHE